MADPFGGAFDGRTVLVTGHTGFKGGWLCHWLASLGARVVGYSDGIATDPSFFVEAGVAGIAADHRGDICDGEALAQVFARERPSAVFHLAAQAIVREAYEKPYETARVNVLGTVQLLEAARRARDVAAVVIVTSDKCYANHGTPWAYRESDTLGGHEPYAASKASAEIMSAVYMSPGFHKAAGSVSPYALATARAGNVIGGGDWARDRLLPDLVRAILAEKDSVLRAPRATRPWQHVLEPLSGYLWLMANLLRDRADARGAWNFGPDNARAWTVGAIAEHVLALWPAKTSRIVVEPDIPGKEAHALRIDSSKAAAELGWAPAWDTGDAVKHTVDWYRAWARREPDLAGLCRRQIAKYTASAGGAAWVDGRRTG